MRFWLAVADAASWLLSNGAARVVDGCGCCLCIVLGGPDSTGGRGGGGGKARAGLVVGGSNAASPCLTLLCLPSCLHDHMSRLDSVGAHGMSNDTSHETHLPDILDPMTRLLASDHVPSGRQPQHAMLMLLTVVHIILLP